MSSWDRDVDLSLRGWMIAAGLAATAVLAWIVLLGTQERTKPMRCPGDFQEQGARCCAPGQSFVLGHCTGLPSDCGPRGALVEEPAIGCVITSTRIPILGGRVTLGPTDWDSVDVMEKKTLAVRSFSIDQLEVTNYRYYECQKAGLCPPLPSIEEPGLPVTGVTVEAAEAYCAFAGGRLPTAAEWTFAAAGPEARRFPWGAHGLVCRRAAFGLVAGPCDENGATPDLAGMRPSGATPQGVQDLAGNVAELSHDSDGRVGLHGGSFRSETASELKSWSLGPVRLGPEVGFRCVYPER